VRGGGQTQVATRPGSMIVTNLGSPPGMPTLLAQGALNAQLGALEGRRAPQGSSSGGGSGRNADQAAQSSGLSAVNSGQSVRIVAPGVQDNFGSGPGPRNRNPNDTLVTALSNANQGVQTTTAVQQQQQQAAAPTPPLPPPPTSFPTSFPGGETPPPPPQPPVPNLPQTGGATYSGVMVGRLHDHTISTGSYQSTWNFSQRSGTFNATFQGANFQGGIAGGPQGTFSTPTAIQSNNQPRQLQVPIGGFFGPRGQPDYQAGEFNITSTNSGNYNAVGAFIGKKQ
jgi:hypothetical protein